MRMLFRCFAAVERKRYNDLKLLRREALYASASDYVVASPRMKGQQPYWRSKIMQANIKPAAEKLGIQLKGWHTLCHTYCTLLNSNGSDPKVVQELLRHASYQITMNTYTQALTDDKRQAHRGVVSLGNL